MAFNDWLIVHQDGCRAIHQLDCNSSRGQKKNKPTIHKNFKRNETEENEWRREKKNRTNGHSNLPKNEIYKTNAACAYNDTNKRRFLFSFSFFFSFPFLYIPPCSLVHNLHFPFCIFQITEIEKKNENRKNRFYSFFLK